MSLCFVYKHRGHDAIGQLSPIENNSSEWWLKVSHSYGHILHAIIYRWWQLSILLYIAYSQYLLPKHCVWMYTLIPHVHPKALVCHSAARHTPFLWTHNNAVMFWQCHLPPQPQLQHIVMATNQLNKQTVLWGMKRWYVHLLLAGHLKSVSYLWTKMVKNLYDL